MNAEASPYHLALTMRVLQDIGMPYPKLESKAMDDVAGLLDNGPDRQALAQAHAALHDAGYQHPHRIPSAMAFTATLVAAGLAPGRIAHAIRLAKQDAGDTARERALYTMIAYRREETDPMMRFRLRFLEELRPGMHARRGRAKQTPTDLAETGKDTEITTQVQNAVKVARRAPTGQ